MSSNIYFMKIVYVQQRQYVYKSSKIILKTKLIN